MKKPMRAPTHALLKVLEIASHKCPHETVEPLPPDAAGNVNGRCTSCGDDTFPIVDKAYEEFVATAPEAQQECGFLAWAKAVTAPPGPYDDESPEPSVSDVLASMPRAVCALVLRDGKLLALSRGLKGADTGDWNFPGGKVDPGETLEQACLRELYEETGFRGRIVRKVYEGVCSGPRDYYTVTFEVESVEDGKIGHATREGVVAWKDPHVLTFYPSSFRIYNIECLAAAGLLL